MRKVKYVLLMIVALGVFTGCSEQSMTNQSVDESKENVAEQTEEPQSTENTKEPQATKSTADVEATPEAKEAEASKKEAKATDILYEAEDFTLQLPANWKNSYITEENVDEEGYYVAFYAKKCSKEIGAGWLFSIARYEDDLYQEQPSYEVLLEEDDCTYVAVFPTDVQFYEASKSAKKQYTKLNKSVEKVLKSFKVKK